MTICVGADRRVRPVCNHNEAFDRVCQEIDTIKNRYFGFDIDAFVVMPNHVHAIVVIENGRTRRSAPTGMALSDLVKNIKTYTTIAYMQGVYQKNGPSFHKQLWQRGRGMSHRRNNISQSVALRCTWISSRPGVQLSGCLST